MNLAYSPSPDMLVRAPTKTIAFTGASALGEAGTAVPVWTTTGRVLLVYMTAYVSEAVVSTLDLGTISLGTSAAATSLIDNTTVGSGTFALGDWWNSDQDSAPSTREHITTTPRVTSLSIIITPATQNITDGTLVMDCFYIPLTAGASLS